MKRFLLALALFLAPALAQAQCNGVFPNNTICGNISGAGNLPRPLANNVLTGVPGGNNGQIEYNNNGLFGGFTPGGDLTFANPNFTINNGAVTNAKLVAGAANTVKSSLNGTTVTDNLLTTLLNAACTLTPSACVTLFGYANPIWYGADPTGAADSATAINAATVASKLVSLSPGGIYKIAVAIKLVANQRFTCNGSTITQGNGAGLQVFFDLTTNTAGNSQIDHCKVDGNIANNGGLANTGVIMIRAFGTNNVNISNNRLTGSPGGVIAIANANGAIVRDNYIDNSISYGILLFNNSAPNTRGNHLVTGNTIVGPMLHLLQLEQVDGNVLTNNILLGQTAYGGATNTMQVTISGTTATSVSGLNFSQATLGTVLVVNGGQEFPITAVNSNTSLTLSSPGSLTNVAAAIGGGDILSLTSTSFNVVEGNFVSGGVTGGIVLAQIGGFLTPNESCVGNLITGNFVEQSGNFGIALEAATVASGATLNQTSVVGNTIIGPGRSGSAGAALAGIQLSSNAGLMNGVLVDGNYAYDPFAVTGGFWLSSSGLNGAINLAVGTNLAQGFTNAGNMSGYPTIASTPVINGNTAYVTDAASCATWGQAVTGGGSTFCQVTWNGSNFTATGK